MALAAKSGAVLKVRKLEEDILVPVGDDQTLCIAAAGDWISWCDDKGFRQFIDAEKFSQDWVLLTE